MNVVLASNTFKRAPRLAGLLEHLGKTYLSGDLDRLKENCIAADFFDRRTSIVRVEAHRLRQRLKEYYASEGATSPVRIVIEPGGYVPRFELVAVPVQPVPPPASNRILWAVAVGVIGAAAMVGSLGRTREEKFVEKFFLPAYRGGSMVDSLGRTWDAAADFCTGSDTLYSRRDDWIHLLFQRQGKLDCAIPMPPGIYEVRLYFSQYLYRQGGVLEPSTGRFDVFAGDKHVVRQDTGLSFRDRPDNVVVAGNIRPDSDGKIRFRFEDGSARAYINGIQITQSFPDRIRPIRIHAKPTHYRDRSGNLWRADQYFKGGYTAMRLEAVSAPGEDENLYSGERYGDFTYQIPVARGAYDLKLHFAETWFVDSGNSDRAADRLMTVLVNKEKVLDNFNVKASAGGPRRAITRTFHNVHPQSDGYIEIAFRGHGYDAIVNAIELNQTTRRE